MKRWGLVREVKGDKAKVEVCGQGGCKKCGQCLGAQRQHQLWAANRIGAKEGERVCLELPTKVALAGGFFLYVFPLILMLAGYGIGILAGSLAGLVGAAVGFCLSIISGSLLNRCLERRGALELQIVKVERKKGGVDDEVFGRSGGDQEKGPGEDASPPR